MFHKFPEFSQELQDKIWDKVVKTQGQGSIFFFQLYTCKNRQGQETSKQVRLDKHSTAAYLARIKITCKGLKEAIERHHQDAIDSGEQFQPITVSVQSGEVQVQVNVQDIVFFGTLEDDSSLTTSATLPVDRHGLLHTGLLFRLPRTFNVPAQWSWIRRVAMSFPPRSVPADAIALICDSNHQCHGPHECYHCTAWKLTGFHNLEEFIYIVKGLPRKPAENRHRLLTEISSEGHTGPYCYWTDVVPSRYYFLQDVVSDGEEDENKDMSETGKSYHSFFLFFLLSPSSFLFILPM